MNSKFIYSLALGAILASCSNSEPESQALENKIPLAFNTEVITNWSTSRSVAEGSVIAESNNDGQNLQIIESDGIESQATSRGNYADITDFSISAYLARQSGSGSAFNTPNYFYNEKATVTGGVGTMDNLFYWPGSGYKLRLFAVSPYNHGQKLMSQSAVGTPTLEVTVPTNAANQKDIMVACSDEQGSTTGNCRLFFNHIMSAIKVYVNPSIVRTKRILNVIISRPKVHGIYTPSLTNQAYQGSWQVTPTSLQPVSTSPVVDRIPEKPSSEDAVIVKNDKMFMLIPQTTAVTITLIVWDDSQGPTIYPSDSQQLDYTFPEVTWEPGKTYLYKIN